MELKTFRARTLQDALRLVRQELGPKAAVVHTREVQGRWYWPFASGGRQFEVSATCDVEVPSRVHAAAPGAGAPPSAPESAARAADVREPAAEQLDSRLGQLQSMVEELCRRSRASGRPELPEHLFRLYAELIECQLEEADARALVDRAASTGATDVAELKARLATEMAGEIRVGGPICAAPARRHVVALVGPTGVGKTTTIAKLAANFRLRERRRVGLITVDTYRIAAVEQLRTYADIMDLPMEVVSTPKEMREAVRRFADLDLVLLDTAGRSPRDEVKIQELRAFVGEAQADEVHLVVSAVSGMHALRSTVERFAVTGATSMILTKLDEASGFGHLLPVLRGPLPLSYVTAGQNVPDDIEAADAARLARGVLGIDRPY